MIDRNLFAEMWLSGVSVPEMAARLGCHSQLIYKLRVGFGLPNRARVNCPDKDPTPEEIAERARECREKHYARRRAETDETSRVKVWKRQQRSSA